MSVGGAPSFASTDAGGKTTLALAPHRTPTLAKVTPDYSFPFLPVTAPSIRVPFSRRLACYSFAFDFAPSSPLSRSFAPFTSASASASNTKSKAQAKPSRGSLFSASSGKGGDGKDGKKKTKDGNGEGEQPAFRPRTLKKGAGGEAYRDRAAERRAGLKGDYAQVGVFCLVGCARRDAGA